MYCSGQVRMVAKKKKKRTNLFDRISLWLTIGFGLALLVSYLSPITDPRKFWPVAFFGLAYPLLLLANFLILVYWMLRWHRFVWIPALSILAGWNTLCNNIGFRASSKGAIANANTVQVMTYNCHNFKPFGGKNDPATRHAMLQMIAKSSPDVIGLQEFFTRRKGKYAMKDSMAKLMGTDHHYFESFNLNTSQDLIGLAIFSKYPIMGTGKIILSDENNGNQCIYADIKKGGHIFRYYCIHLQSIRFVQEDYSYLSRVSEDGKPDMTSSRRIGGKLKRAFMKRAEQVYKIREHANQSPYPYIIAGDFNDTPSSFAVNRMAKGLKNAFREKGSGFARTYNGSFPNYQIDYVMASPGLGVADYHIIPEKLSDHYPVTSTLLFK